MGSVESPSLEELLQTVEELKADLASAPSTTATPTAMPEPGAEGPHALSAKSAEGEGPPGTTAQPQTFEIALEVAGRHIAALRELAGEKV